MSGCTSSRSLAEPSQHPSWWEKKPGTAHTSSVISPWALRVGSCGWENSYKPTSTCWLGWEALLFQLMVNLWSHLWNNGRCRTQIILTQHPPKWLFLSGNRFLAECQIFNFTEFRGQSFGRVMIIINSAHGSPSDVFEKLKHDFALISFWSALPTNRSRFIAAKVLRSM